MKRIIAFILLLLASKTFSENNSYSDLLQYRLKNDRLYSTIKNNWKIEKNNYDKTKLNAYFSANLTTGNIDFLLDSDKSKSEFSIDPSILLGSPALNNLGLQLSFPSGNIGNGLQTKSGFELGLSVDIYSQARNKAKLQIDIARQKLAYAEKQLALQEKLIEKKFLGEVKKMLSEYAGLLKAKLETTQANLQYRQLEAQGYNKSATKLSTAKLNLMRTQREEKENEFSFSDTLNRFFDSCNLKIENNAVDSFLLKLSQSIPKTKLIEIDKLTEQNYSKLQNAEEEYKTILRKNKIALNIFSAKANTKYSNSITNKKGTENIQAGVTMMFPGCEFYTGAIFTTTPKNSTPPNLRFKISVNPLEIYNYILTKQNTKLSEENELAKLQELRYNFQAEIKQLVIKRNKFEWQEKLFAEEIEIYKQNAKDHRQLFNQGIISELEKNQAELEYKQAVLREANTKIDSTIFNIDITEKFNAHQ